MKKTMLGKLHCKSLMLVTADNCGFPFFLTVMITKTKVKRTFTEGVAGSWDCCARGALAAEPLPEASCDAARKNPAFHITYAVLNSSLRKLGVVAWNRSRSCLEP